MRGKPYIDELQIGVPLCLETSGLANIVYTKWVGIAVML
jgi:hypothetical protein